MKNQVDKTRPDNVTELQRCNAQLQEENTALREEINALRAAHQTNPVNHEARSAAENGYDESQFRFRTIFEQSRLGNKIISSDLRIIKANKTLQEMLGYSEEELIGTRITDYAHSDSQQHWQELQAKLWKQEMPSFHIEANMVRKDGTTRWCSVTTFLFGDHEIMLGYSILEDISQRKALEEKPANLESVLAQNQQAAGVGSFIADLETGMVQCSPILNRIFGFPEGEQCMHRDAFFSVFDAASRERHQQILAKAIAQVGSYASEYKIIVGGLEKWVWEKGEVRKDEEGKWKVLGTVQANDSQTLQLLLGIINGTTSTVTVGKPVRDEQGKIIDFRYVLFNNTAKQHIGASDEDTYMIGKTLTELFPAARHNGNLERYIDAFENNKSYQGIEYFHLREGISHWFSESAYCFGDYIVITLTDITDRKQSEERLRNTEALLIESQKIANIGAFEWAEDMSGGVGSPQFYQILGLDDQAPISRETYSSAIHPEDIPALNEYIANWEKNKGLFQTEYRIIRKDGAIRHVWVRANLVGGKLMGALMDITERKQAEEKLRRSEALLLQSEKIANIGAFDWSADVTSGTGSPQLYKILGFDEPELFLIGDFLQIMHPEDVPRITQYIANWVKTGGVFETEYRIMRKNDGVLRHVWVRGDVVGERLMGYLMDITERVEMERSNKKLAIRNDELDNFVYTASHDLRAPLNSMETLVEYLSQEIGSTKENAKGQLYLEWLNKSIANLKNTLEDLTTVTEIHPGEKKELVNLKTVVEEVQASLYKQIQEAGAVIKVDLSVPFLSIPKKHARSLVFNMLSNALKFRSPERKPVITISSHLEKDKTRLSFADNGIGIKAVNQPKVFMIFKRFNPEIAGRGVGMYLVKRVIDLNGGDIHLESKENVGTTFHVQFPTENF